VSNDSRAPTFIVGEESTETQNAVAISRNISSPTCSSESRQQSKPEPNGQDRLLNLHDLVQAQTNHSLILSAIKSFDQLVSGHRGSKDETTLAIKDRQNQNDSQSSLSGASQLQSSTVRQLQQQQESAASQEQSKFFGLPGRITVSKREINMMSQISF